MADITLDSTKVVFSTPVGALRVTDNDINNADDGGRVVFTLSGDDEQAKAAQRFLLDEKKVRAVTALVNFGRDEPMAAFPVTRTEREARRFTLYVVEE